MAKEQSVVEIPNTSSRIGKKTVYDGVLKFSTSISIQGIVKGKIFGGELLIVLPGGQVEGDIVVDYLLVVGGVYGNIHAKKGVYFYDGSVVRGKVLSAVIRMQTGVDFEGECNISEEEENDIFSMSREAFYASEFDRLAHELDEISERLSTR